MESEQLSAQGILNIELGRFPEARRDLEAALRLDPNNVEAQANLAAVLRVQRHDGHADMMFARLIDHPEFGAFACRNRCLIELHRGLAMQDQGQPAQREFAAARHWGIEAVRRDPTDVSARTALSRALSSFGDVYGGIAEAQRAINVAGTNPDDRIEALGAMALALLHDPARKHEAVSVAMEAQAIDPTSAHAAEVLAVAQAESGGQLLRSLRTAYEQLRSTPVGTQLPEVANLVLNVVLTRLLVLTTWLNVSAFIMSLSMSDLTGIDINTLAAGWGLLGLLVVVVVTVHPVAERRTRRAVWQFAKRSPMAWLTTIMLVGFAAACAMSINSWPVYLTTLPPLIVLTLIQRKRTHS